MGKKLLILTVSALLAGVSLPPVEAAEPPPDDPVSTEQGADQGPIDGAPFPPDGVTDPDVVYPTDGTDGVDQGEFGLIPYLRDESQAVAREFGAETTPDVFVLDDELRLRYRGAPDGDHDDPAQNAGFLRDALDALLAGRNPDPARTTSVGCTVKWRK